VEKGWLLHDLYRSNTVKQRKGQLIQQLFTGFLSQSAFYPDGFPTFLMIFNHLIKT